MFFNYDNLQMRYEPFPIGLAKPIMDAATYGSLVEAYPPMELFANIPKLGKKYSLSEKFNPREYRNLVRTNPVWREFHQWLKSDAFVRDVLNALAERHIELGYDMTLAPWQRLVRFARHYARGRTTANLARLTSRFEFSMLPADGGHILPHTDAPSKIVTLIVSILKEDEWNPEFGGGTDINRPKEMSLSFNRLNRQAGFEDMDVLDTFEFTPNQAVLFVKTFNSWHSVRPMKGQGSPAMRKTLTINIETRL